MRKDSQIRFANGVASALLLFFVVVHALAGGLHSLGLIGRALGLLAWVGVVLAATHMLLSIVTSRRMMTDADDPPSDKKKRHLVLKWVTGAVVLLALAAHVALRVCDAPMAFDAAATVVLIAALTAHSCVGSKSLLKDLGFPRNLRNPLRAAIVIIAVCLLALFLVSSFHVA